MPRVIAVDAWPSPALIRRHQAPTPSRPATYVAGFSYLKKPITIYHHYIDNVYTGTM